jgi:hypothetical protein
MSLKLTLFTKDANCTDIISVEIAHFTNFDNKNSYHCHLIDEQIKLVTALTINKISFTVEFGKVFIDETSIKVRLDSK